MTGVMEERRGVGREAVIYFADSAGAGDAVLMHFREPVEGYALTSESRAQRSERKLQVLVVPSADGVVPPGDDAALRVRSQGCEVWWIRGRAVLRCEERHAEELVAAVVEFAWYEELLHQMEQEVAEGWASLEEDKQLAFAVTPADLKQRARTGERMARAFARRIRYARMAPRLLRPEVALQPAAQKLGAALRQAAETEERAEDLDGQLEVFEHIYEMSSQRIGEYEAARQGHFMEWVIIWLLAAEVLLTLAQTAWRWLA